MRSNDDIVKVRIHLYAIADLDWERIEQDPNWALVSEPFDLSDPEQKQEALFRYIMNYVSREQLFANQPVYGTNGPSELFVTNMEDVTHGSSNSIQGNGRDDVTVVRGQNSTGL